MLSHLINLKNSSRTATAFCLGKDNAEGGIHKKISDPDSNQLHFINMGHVPGTKTHHPTMPVSWMGNRPKVI